MAARCWRLATDRHPPANGQPHSGCFTAPVEQTDPPIAESIAQFLALRKVFVQAQDAAPRAARGPERPSPYSPAMGIAILTFPGFDGLDSCIAMGVLNRIPQPGLPG